MAARLVLSGGVRGVWSIGGGAVVLAGVIEPEAKGGTRGVIFFGAGNRLKSGVLERCL